jgi:hypothetical protein
MTPNNTSVTIAWMDTSVDLVGVHVDVSDSCGFISSNDKWIHVRNAPQITNQPADVYAYFSDPVSFSVQTLGGSLTDITEKWYHNGLMVHTGYYFPFTVSSYNDTGAYYCIIYGVCDTIASDTARLHLTIPTGLENNLLTPDVNITYHNEKLGIKFSDDWKESWIEIFNGIGQVIKVQFLSADKNESEIPFNTNTGIYFYRIIRNEKYISGNFFVPN